MRIMLINSGNDETDIGNANVSSYPPLGIISIASTIENFFSSFTECELVDGQIDGLQEAVRRIEEFVPDILCISMYCTSINFTMQCAITGRKVGATVILGNDHAKAHYDTILSNSDSVDIISLDEFGERTMYFYLNNIINKVGSGNVPYTASRNHDGSIAVVDKVESIEYGPVWDNPLDFFPLPNRSLLNRRYWSTYNNNFRSNIKSKTLNVDAISGVTTINRLRGCPQYRQKCLYCGIGDLSPCATKTSYWDDVTASYAQIGANCFYECCDNMTFFKTFLTCMLRSKPDLIDPHFLFYASTIGITPEICDIMHDIGAFYLNFGFDSGNDHALRILKGKRHSVADNIKAAELATRKKMDIHVSFVLFGMGSRNETIQSCEESLKLATWLAESTNATTIECALLYPDRAAPIGNLIWNPGSYERLRKIYDLSFLDMGIILQLNEKYRNLIYINPDEIISDFCKACGVDVNLLLEYQTKIKDCCRKANIRFGYSQYGKDHGVNQVC